MTDVPHPAPDEPFRPTAAAPQPEPAPPSGPAVGAVAAEDPHPEKKVGKAFAGGLGAAILLRLLARRRHRK